MEKIPDENKYKEYLQATVQYVYQAGLMSREKLGECTRRLPGGYEAMQTAAGQTRKEVEKYYEQENQIYSVHRESPGLT